MIQVNMQNTLVFFTRAAAVEVCCSVLQCVAVCCSVLQCVAVCCSVCSYKRDLRRPTKETFKRDLHLHVQQRWK